MDRVTACCETAVMTKRVKSRLKHHPRHFIREWRRHRGLGQEQLAARVDMTTSSISQIETYKQGWTDETLAAIAEALQCSPGDLLIRNPLEEEAPWSIWDRLTAEKRRTFMRIIKAVDDDDGDKLAS